MRMNKIEYLTNSNHKLTIKFSPNSKHKHYNGSQQDSGEMTLFLHCSTFLHELFWVFRPKSLIRMKYRAYKS